MATQLIAYELKQVEQNHGGSRNHWVVGIINITVKKWYNLQYLTMITSGNMNDPTEP